MTTVATTIYQQLGGGRFAAMTGAKDFISSGPALLFRIPSRNKHGITHLRIKLELTDTYSVEFMKFRGTKGGPVAEYSGVYADQLQPLFTKVTGLETHL